MIDEPKAMKEIHEIREKIYEERKNMTPAEYNAEVHKRSQALLDRYEIKVERVEVPKRQILREEPSECI